LGCHAREEPASHDVKGMTIYFDTNVYRFLREKDEGSALRRLIQRHSCRLIASSENLFETLAIADSLERRIEVGCLTEFATAYETKPVSFFHALEVRQELKRLRRSWLEPMPFEGSIRKQLRSNELHWTLARQMKLPDPQAYSAYRRDAERGVKQLRDSQRSMRQVVREGSDLMLQGPDGEGSVLDLQDAESFWRVESLAVWFQAIQAKHPSSRDYADWLSPYLKPRVFAEPSYRSFWLEEVEADAVPLNRVTGLVSYYQLQAKVTHGNATDQLHAGFWRLTGLFFTCDRAFHHALDKVATEHFPGVRRPVFIDRGASSCVEQIDAGIRLARD
jgi:hypothetical protein